MRPARSSLLSQCTEKKIAPFDSIHADYHARQARQRLANAGISVNNPEPTTSLANVRSETINGAIALKQACGCTLVVTGGTEKGHTAGTYSHANGYKLDFRLNTGLTSFIQGQYTAAGTRSDGAKVSHSF